jgi:hypothetical protein
MRRSRHGLVLCAGCGTHVRTDSAAAAAACPHCGSALHGSASTDTPLRRASRSGLLVGALLGVPLAACGSEEEAPMPMYGMPMDVISDEDGAAGDVGGSDAATPDAGPALDADELPDGAVAPLYGMPADVGGDPDAGSGEDVPIAPAYGLPMDVSETPDDAVEEPDGMFQPMYGMPSDVGEEADAAADDDVPAAPPYGTFPMPDAGEPEEDIPAVPAYGIPPEDGFFP